MRLVGPVSKRGARTRVLCIGFRCWSWQERCGAPSPTATRQIGKQSVLCGGRGLTHSAALQSDRCDSNGRELDGYLRSSSRQIKFPWRFCRWWRAAGPAARGQIYFFLRQTVNRNRKPGRATAAIAL